MLNNISKKINRELQEEQNRIDFKLLINEDTFDSIDDKLLHLNENGVNENMLKKEMPFLFVEDTVVDDTLVTNLQNELDYEDNFNREVISDSDELTDLQEPVDYDDNFAVKYANDVDVDTDLFKEVNYNDNKDTPVNIDEYSNESVDLLVDMGDLELMEDCCCDCTTPNEVDCPDEGEEIEQAEEADVDEETEEPEGSVVEDFLGLVEEDEEAIEESFFGLTEEDESDDEDSDEEDELDSDEEDEFDDEDSDEEAIEESFFGF
jgi:hypothetical protein